MKKPSHHISIVMSMGSANTIAPPKARESPTRNARSALACETCAFSVVMKDYSRMTAATPRNGALVYRRNTFTAFVALCVLLFPARTLAAAGEMRPTRSIEVTGEARVDVPPDLALADFAVVTQADTAEAAARENSSRMEKVVAALRKAAGADASISTGAYSIRPVYTTPKERTEPRISGYNVTNTVHVRTKALAQFGTVIDAAVQAGANQVQRLTFTLSDDSEPRRAALGRASTQARDKAQSIAASLGLKAGRVLSVVEQDAGGVRPLVREAYAVQAASAPTPIEPGAVEVRARVVLTVELDQ